MKLKATKKSILKLPLALLFFVILFAFVFIAYTPAQALNDYNKEATGLLHASEWNQLLDDFVTKNNGGDDMFGNYILHPINTSGTVSFLNLGDSGSRLFSSGDFSIQAGTSDVINFLSGGNVGINTTTPTNKLSIDGGTANVLNVNGGKIIGLDYVPANRDDAVPLSYLEDNYSSSANSFWNGVKDENIWNGTSGLGHVGIGLTNPIFKLSVDGDAAFGSTDDGVIIKAASSTNSTGFAEIVGADIMGSAANGLQFRTNTNPAMTILTNSNIGIGTTNPNYKLSIQGSGDTGLIAFNNSTNSQAYFGLGYDQGSDGLSFKYNRASSGLDSLAMFVNRSGAVGVGTDNLTGAKFKILSDNSVSIEDSYDDESKVASLTGAVIASGKLQIIGVPDCGEYSVTDSEGLTYGTVVADDGNCWLDRNLGATRVATALNDAQSYGDYYQWGREMDGHEKSDSASTDTLSSSDQVPFPDTAKFIKSAISPYDWRSPQNDNLWQGVDGINNPCPTGFRLPTQTEWAILVTAEGITNYSTAYASSLKLSAAGLRNRSNAGLNSQGSYGFYWSSSVYSSNAYTLRFYSSSVTPANSYNRANGFSVRCVKD